MFIPWIGNYVVVSFPLPTPILFLDTHTGGLDADHVPFTNRSLNSRLRSLTVHFSTLLFSKSEAMNVRVRACTLPRCVRQSVFCFSDSA